MVNRFISSIFIASATVAIVGQLAFLGIIVPHVVRKLVGAITEYLFVLQLLAVVIVSG